MDPGSGEANKFRNCIFYIYLTILARMFVMGPKEPRNVIKLRASGQSAGRENIPAFQMLHVVHCKRNLTYLSWPTHIFLWSHFMFCQLHEVTYDVS